MFQNLIQSFFKCHSYWKEYEDSRKRQKSLFISRGAFSVCVLHTKPANLFFQHFLICHMKSNTTSIPSPAKKPNPYHTKGLLLWVCTKTCHWNKMTDCLKKVEMGCQTSCSTIYWNLYFNWLHKGSREKKTTTKTNKPQTLHISISIYLSLQLFPYLWYFAIIPISYLVLGTERNIILQEKKKHFGKKKLSLGPIHPHADFR